MPIKGLVDENMRQDARIPGRLVKIGTIQKGKRDGYGKDIKLYDLPYFRFTPTNGDERLTAAFHEAYGEEPTEIPDVRIPVDAAGNFDILDCSWSIAAKHTEKGSTFLARSDGRYIKQARDENDGRKVNFFYDGELPHEEGSQTDSKGRDCFVYAGKLYPWQNSFAIDLILPAFNRLVFQDGIVGYGAVTLITTSANDIASLTKEYYTIIEELAAPFINPMIGNIEQVKKYLPLRNFPIRLFRQVENIGTPDYRKDAAPGDRLKAQKSLLHWQVAPEFSASIQDALDQRTAALITAAAKQSFLVDKKQEVARLEADLFPDAPQIPDTVGDVEYTGPDWESLTPEDYDEADYEPEPDPEPYDWKEAALNAETIDGFCMAYFNLSSKSGVFDDATAVRKAFHHFFGKGGIDPNHTNYYIKALNAYVNVLADGGLVRDAKEKAAAVFSDLIEGVPF